MWHRGKRGESSDLVTHQDQFAGDFRLTGNKSCAVQGWEMNTRPYIFSQKKRGLHGTFKNPIQPLRTIGVRVYGTSCIGSMDG